MTLHYSDEETDYPVVFQLWEPADLARIEAGLLGLGIPLRAEKFADFKQAIEDCLAEVSDRFKEQLTSLLTLNFQTFENVSL